MNRFYRNIFFWNLPISLIITIFFDPVIHPDSKDYISYHPARSVGYPFFIYILNKNLKLVLFFQVFFSFLSLALFIKELKSFFNFNNFILIFFSSVLVVIITKISLNILTGSLAFSLFLLFMITIMKAIKKKEDTFLYLSLLILLVGIIIRPQLIFLITSLLLTVFFLLVKNFKKKTLLFFPLVSLVFFLPNKINLHFNSLLNQVNVPIADTWNQLMILPIFISKEQVIAKNNSNYKDLLINVHECVKKKGLTKYISEKNGSNWLYILEDNSFVIKNCSNVEIEKKFPNNNITENEEISKKLFLNFLLVNLQHDKINFFKSYFLKYSTAFVNQYYLLIFLFFTFFLVYQFFKNNSDIFFFFIQLIFTHFCNLLIILIGAPFLTRFKFYTELILILILLSVIIDYFRKKMVKDKNEK